MNTWITRQKTIWFKQDIYVEDENMREDKDARVDIDKKGRWRKSSRRYRI